MTLEGFGHPSNPLGEAKPALKAPGAAPKPSGSLSPGQGGRILSVLRRHRGWAASGLCEILVVTFALFPLPPRLCFWVSRRGWEGGQGDKGYLSFINHNFFHPWSCTEKNTFSSLTTAPALIAEEQSFLFWKLLLGWGLPGPGCEGKGAGWTPISASLNSGVWGLERFRPFNPIL